MNGFPFVVFSKIMKICKYVYTCRTRIIKEKPFPKRFLFLKIWSPEVVIPSTENNSLNSYQRLMHDWAHAEQYEVLMRKRYGRMCYSCSYTYCKVKLLQKTDGYNPWYRNFSSDELLKTSFLWRVFLELKQFVRNLLNLLKLLY